MKVFGLAGYSGSGKTTLLEELIPRLTAAGLRVSLIKHAHHRFDIDQPGKDSYRLREAGCSEVLLVSDHRWVLMHELRGAPEPSLEEQIARFSECDLVLVEGFKQTPIPKLEVYRPSVGKPLIAGTGVETIVAIATDEPAALAGRTSLPILELNDRDAIADFMERRIEPFHMAHLDQPAIAPGGRRDHAGLRQIRRDRFFDKHVDAAVQQFNGHVGVGARGDGDDGEINTRKIGKAVINRGFKPVTHFFRAVRPDVNHSRQMGEGRVGQDPGVMKSEVADANHSARQHFGLFHTHQLYRRFRERQGNLVNVIGRRRRRRRLGRRRR